MKEMNKMNEYVQQYICGYNSNNEFYCRSHLIRFDYNIQEYISDSASL